MITINNLITVMRHPSHIGYYFRYLMSKAIHHGNAITTITENVRLGFFSNYSEYRSTPKFVNLAELNFLQTYPFPSGCIVDVGANLGAFTVLLAKRYPERIIYSIEPNPSAFSSLGGNVDLNHLQNVKLYGFALADKNSFISFLVQDRDRATCRINLNDPALGLRVEAISLDFFSHHHGLEHIALLKIDVEGFEAAVIRGAEELLTKNPPSVIYYEVCPVNCETLHRDPTEATRLLMEYGYAIHSITDSGTLQQLQNPSIDNVQSTSWVAIRPD